MKALLILFSLSLFFMEIVKADEKENAKKDYQFLMTKLKTSEYQFKFGPLEQIISGAASSAIGIAGYHLSSNNSAKLAYSAVQTIGSINAGLGVYNYFAPKETEKTKAILRGNKTKGDFSKNYIYQEIIFQQEEAKAKRYALMSTSAALTLQYASNILIGDSDQENIEKIYLFLGGVNFITFIYQAFFITDIEKYRPHTKSLILHPGAKGKLVLSYHFGF